MIYKSNKQHFILLIAFATIMIATIFFSACNVTSESTQDHTPTTTNSENPENTQSTVPTTLPISPEDSNQTDIIPSEPIEATEPVNVTEPNTETTIDANDPTEPTEPSEPTNPQEPTDPTEDNEPETSEPVPSEPPATEPTPDTSVTYLEYYAMSAEEQQAFIDSFGSIDAFFQWHKAAQKEYEENRTPIDGSTSLVP